MPQRAVHIIKIEMATMAKHTKMYRSNIQMKTLVNKVHTVNTVMYKIYNICSNVQNITNRTFDRYTVKTISRMVQDGDFMSALEYTRSQRNEQE